MSKPFLKFGNVTFAYDSSYECLFENVSFHAGSGWSAVVGANGSGKTTLLKLATGLLKPNEGRIESPPDLVYCEQRTDEVPEGLAELAFARAGSDYAIKSRLGIQEDWHDRWETLSHGERKRAQIAVSIRAQPRLLAIDEPTNHVDAQARKSIIAALSCFRGVGLLVSHDRELIDSLCHQCLFLEPPTVIVRPGGIAKGLQIAKIEQETLKRERAKMKLRHRALRKEHQRRRASARNARQIVSKRQLAPKDHDGREKKDRARLSGKDAIAGKLQKQLHKRIASIEEQTAAMEIAKEHRLGIWLPGCRSKQNVLLELKAGILPLGNNRRLSYPDLSIRPQDRIAVTGPNGSGKSTLTRHIVKSLKLPSEHITYVPQEITLSDSSRILARVKALSPDKLGHLMTIVSRLGSNPQQLLTSDAPSPGEMRKLLLAVGMTHTPHIVVMDEPTNHMDLPSIQCLEEALSNCPCSLLLISHDTCFLRKLTNTFWDIGESDTPGKTVLTSKRTL